MRSIRLPFLGAMVAIGLVATIACGTSGQSGQELTSERSLAPDFSIPVVRTTGADGFESGQFTLSEERGSPLVLYFSFPG